MPLRFGLDICGDWVTVKRVMTIHTRHRMADIPLSSDADDQPPAWLRGVRRYQESIYRRPESDAPVVWQRGKVTCLHISHRESVPPDAPVVLLVPSLINRYYILDLMEQLSLARYLASQSMHVYIIDWSKPQPEDADQDVEHYINEYLLPLQDTLRARHQRPLTLLGYCVGGLLALALQVLQPETAERLILLATPWDFHEQGGRPVIFNCWQSLVTDSLCRCTPLVPGSYLSWLFFLSDPAQSEAKYRHFARLDEDSSDFQRFLAVEHWLNDTVPLTRAFAKTCLIDWPMGNKTARGEWRVADEYIDPGRLRVPLLVVAPRHDRIVPPASAMRLAEQVPHAEILSPESGHIGMIIGRKRHTILWEPLRDWILRKGA